MHFKVLLLHIYYIYTNKSAYPIFQKDVSTHPNISYPNPCFLVFKKILYLTISTHYLSNSTLNKFNKYTYTHVPTHILMYTHIHKNGPSSKYWNLLLSTHCLSNSILMNSLTQTNYKYTPIQKHIIYTQTFIYIFIRSNIKLSKMKVNYNLEKQAFIYGQRRKY